MKRPELGQRISAQYRLMRSLDAYNTTGQAYSWVRNDWSDKIYEGVYTGYRTVSDGLRKKPGDRYQSYQYFEVWLMTHSETRTPYYVLPDDCHLS